VYGTDGPTSTKGTAANNSRSLMAVVMRKDRTTLFTAVQVSGGATEFAWVMPTPAPPDRVETAHKGLFDWLEHRTAPTVEVLSAPPTYFGGGGGGGSSGCGCYGGDAEEGSMAGGASFGDQSKDSVKVHSSGEAGPFDWLVLGASDAKNMVKWLGDKGYALAVDDVAALQDYVDRGWSFTVMRIKRDSVATEVVVPMALSWPGSSAELPLRIMASSTLAKIGVTVWLIAPQRQEAANYPTIPVSKAELQSISADSIAEDYESAVNATIMTAGGRAFIVEYALPVNWAAHKGIADVADLAGEATAVGANAMLTRLRTRMVPADLDADLTLRPSSDADLLTGDYTVDKRDPNRTGPADTASYGLLLLCGLLLGSRRRRRR